MYSKDLISLIISTFHLSSTSLLFPQQIDVKVKTIYFSQDGYLSPPLPTCYTYVKYGDLT